MYPPLWQALRPPGCRLELGGRGSARRRIRWRRLGAFVAVVLVGACGPSWRDLQRSRPPALEGLDRVAVRFGHDNACVQGGEEPPEGQQPSPERRDELKAIVDQGFLDGLKEQLPNTQVSRASGDEPIVMTVHWISVWMHRFEYTIGQGGDVKTSLAAVVTFEKDGRYTDVIAASSRQNQLPWGQTGRMREMAMEVGQSAGAFVASARGTGDRGEPPPEPVWNERLCPRGTYVKQKYVDCETPYGDRCTDEAVGTAITYYDDVVGFCVNNRGFKLLCEPLPGVCDGAVQDITEERVVCGEPEEAATESATEPASETASETEPEAAPDTEPEAAPDTEPEAAPDTEP